MSGLAHRPRPLRRYGGVFPVPDANPDFASRSRIRVKTWGSPSDMGNANRRESGAIPAQHTCVGADPVARRHLT